MNGAARATARPTASVTTALLGKLVFQRVTADWPKFLFSTKSGFACNHGQRCGWTRQPCVTHSITIYARHRLSSRTAMAQGTIHGFAHLNF